MQQVCNQPAEGDEAGTQWVHGLCQLPANRHRVTTAMTDPSGVTADVALVHLNKEFDRAKTDQIHRFLRDQHDLHSQFPFTDSDGGDAGSEDSDTESIFTQRLDLYRVRPQSARAWPAYSRNDDMASVATSVGDSLPPKPSGYGKDLSDLMCVGDKIPLSRDRGGSLRTTSSQKSQPVRRESSLDRPKQERTVMSPRIQGEMKRENSLTRARSRTRRRDGQTKATDNSYTKLPDTVGTRELSPLTRLTQRDHSGSCTGTRDRSAPRSDTLPRDISASRESCTLPRDLSESRGIANAAAKRDRSTSQSRDGIGHRDSSSTRLPGVEMTSPLPSPPNQKQPFGDQLDIARSGIARRSYRLYEPVSDPKAGGHGPSPAETEFLRDVRGTARHSFGQTSTSGAIGRRRRTETNTQGALLPGNNSQNRRMLDQGNDASKVDRQFTYTNSNADEVSRGLTSTSNARHGARGYHSTHARHENNHQSDRPKTLKQLDTNELADAQSRGVTFRSTRTITLSRPSSDSRRERSQVMAKLPPLESTNNSTTSSSSGAGIVT